MRDFSSVQCDHLGKHTICINDKGEIYAFGEGDHARLGTGHTSNCKQPELLTFFNNIPIKKVVVAKEYSFGRSNTARWDLIWMR